MTKYIFVTGGVVSSIGKGIVSSSLGRLLKNRGLKVAIQKLDPYLNVDPGSMSPYQHGEVFVTDDGAETDLDLGHYERFVDINLNKYSSISAGRVYSNVLENERQGEYGGATVQVIPHITDEIKNHIIRAGETTQADIVISEIGGTVGDIEALPFLEALRQMKREVGAENVLYIHTTLIPYIKAAGELKTKPTQHSVKELRSLGIQPNILVVRTEEALPRHIREKLALFCDVDVEAVIESRDVETLFTIPLNLQKQHMDDVVVDYFGIDVPPADMSDWKELEQRVLNLKDKVTIGLVGKYVSLPDAYLSATEALRHAGYHYDAEIDLRWIDSEEVTPETVAELLNDVDAIFVPGGQGKRGFEGKITAIQYAREQGVPFYGLGLGMQLATVEYARHMANIEEATTGERDPRATHKIVDAITNTHHELEVGQTSRRGLFPIMLKVGSLADDIYEEVQEEHMIKERHRNRYEFNNEYRDILTEHGLVFSGVSPDNRFVEIIELPKEEHPFFIGTIYHPEFVSRPSRPHPIFTAFVKAALEHQENR
ncbi:CTP synthase [Dolosicoccus paucivorans]|uniref:CTP synthase n=1 Tax=Dolosicoccus paucivorans TaxID=84521 RepID=A0A2N6SN48_9LACT|nr:CTP synthase [Dolosicoccus paucivorans]PMB84250.1 CTP synthase [Dolosicoccus paucivorans]PMC58504.1 CTP synthase [Dolosicoccus paucivorans]